MPLPRIADRKNEFDLVRRMLAGETEKRILVVEAPSKTGKSMLLEALADSAKELGAPYCVVVELKNCPTIGDVCAQIVEELGAATCPQSILARQSVGPAVTINASLAEATIGSHADIRVQPVIQSAGLEQISKALVADLGALAARTLLIFDTYEKAGHDLRQWLSGQLLPAVRRRQMICAVIAGIEVPDCKDITWRSCAVLHRLKTIESADEWHQYASAHFPGIKRSDLEVILAGINDPETIWNWIQRAGERQTTSASGGV